MNNKVMMFSASWCGPCQKAKPMFEELSVRYAAVAEFELRDVDDHDGENDPVKEFGILSVPTFVLFQGREEVLRSVGDFGVIESALQNLE